MRKPSIGIREGRVAAIGRAGNPDTMDGVDVVLGTGTAILDGEGLIVTPGAIDTHVHLLSPAVADARSRAASRRSSRRTSAPSGTSAPTPSRPSRAAWAALEDVPLNFALPGARLLVAPGAAARPALEAGGAGLKIHEDVGAARTQIDTALTSATRTTSSSPIHTDGLNEVLSVEDTLDVFAGRTIHAFHIEGAGGGHAPDVLRLAGREPNIIASSTNPTIPFGVHAVAEHVAMVPRCTRCEPELSTATLTIGPRPRARPRRWAPRACCTTSG